jgi:hypothetical protein
MFRIDNPTAAATLPAPSVPGTPGFFTDGSAVGGIPATVVPAEWLNAVQEELVNAVTSLGAATSKADNTQLATAMRGRLINIQVFAVAGTYNYTPSTGTKKVRVTVTGGGGGSGAITSTGSSQIAASSGGSGGGTAISFLSSGFAGASLVVGPGGTAGASGGAGGNGGTSSFGALLSATGGGGSLGGAAATNLTVGSFPPGVGSSGNVLNMPGGYGGISFAIAASQSAFGGCGGSSFFAGNNTFPATGTPGISQAGTAGTSYGQGASGAAASSSAPAKAGAAGAAGVIIIEEFA